MRHFAAWTTVFGLATSSLALNIIAAPRHWIPSVFFGVPSIGAAFFWTYRRVIVATALAIIVFVVASTLTSGGFIQIELGTVALILLGIVGLSISSVRGREQANRLGLESRERELAIEHARLRAALSVSHVMLFSQDRDLRFNWVGRLVGNAEPDILGKTDYDLLSNYDASQMTGLKRRVIREGRGIQQDVRLTIDEQPVFLNVSIEPLREDHEKITGVIVAAVDVSALHRLLDTEQTARRDAEAARSLLEVFSASIAHDVRQPLTVIVGGIQLLRMRLNRLNQQDHIIELMSESVQRMDRLLIDLQDIGELGSSDYRISPQWTELGQLIESVVAALKLGEPHVSIDAAVPPNLKGYWDPDRITQVMTNLVANAIKFSPPDGRIQISAERDDQLCRCSITDQGPGVAEEDRELVFEPFHRLTSSRIVPGSGLGLFISKKIVEVHGGEIRIEDNPDGPGARVIFTLPMSPAREPPA